MLNLQKRNINKLKNLRTKNSINQLIITMNPTQAPHKYSDPRYNEDEDRRIPIVDAIGGVKQRFIVDTRKVELKILKDMYRKFKNIRMISGIEDAPQNINEVKK